MNSAERERLMREMSGEPARPVGTLITCAVGLGVVALLAAIGNSAMESHAVAPEAVPTYAGVHPATGGAADADRKKMFDERRARFAGEAPRHLDASTDGHVANYVALSCSGGPDGGMDATGNECNRPTPMIASGAKAEDGLLAPRR